MKARLLTIGNVLGLLIFAISFEQWPLYSSNQNTYFIHGLANAGVGYLNMDWIAQTTDPFPIFSALVSTTIQILGENAFYFHQIILQGIYAYSILGIGSHIFGFYSMSAQHIIYYVLLTGLYSGWLARFLSELPILQQFSFVIEANGLLTRGVAGQYILGPAFLQPSVFGVFLLLSIYCFLRARHFSAVVCLSIAVIFHSSYMLSAIALTCAYIIIIFIQGKDYRKVLLLAATSLVLVMPIIVYSYVNFNPTTISVSVQAQTILVDYRMPHHTKIESWFDLYTFFQVMVVIIAIYLTRRTKLFLILLVPFLLSVILTIFQVLTENKWLALLFPWRISVFLVPIASSIILASLASTAFPIASRLNFKITKTLQATFLMVIIILGYLGISRTITLLNTPRIGFTMSAEFASNTFQPGDLYLIPTNIESFRLAAKVPIFVDYKSHPYKDVEVVEWFEKLESANKFYDVNGNTACEIIQNISDKYGVTHVMLRLESKASIANCKILHEIYKDTDFLIYEVKNY